MKIVVAITGASGSLYAQRLIEHLCPVVQELHVVLSSHAEEVATAEIGSYTFPGKVIRHGNNTMQVPFVSGSAKFDAMVVVPCSMGTLARIAYGYSDSTITRSADVFLKEKRKLILVPRETPWNLIQARNVVTVIEAGATLLPAIPSFYGKPQNVTDIIDTVVARILDHIGVEHPLGTRWKKAPSHEE